MLKVENVASPDASVATGAPPDSTPVPPCAVSAMVTPLTGLPPLSVTLTTTGGAMTAPAAVFPGCCVNARVTPVPPTLVSAKLAGVATPATDAVTVYAPAAAFATALTLAWPPASVVAVAEDNVADAPVAGAAKLTVTPLSGLPEASLTSTCSGAAKGARTVVLCGVPAMAVIVDAAPAVIVKALLCADTSEVPTAVNW